MYSVVLMMALTTGGDLPAHHGRGGGCCGCVGSYGGCYGGCGGGCWGGRRHHRVGRRGGRCGCWGSTCFGNYGGCCGAPVVVSCGCCGGAVSAPAWTEPMTPPPPPPSGPPPGKAPEKIAPPRGTMAPVAAPAVIVVNLPADAALRVDGQLTTSASAVRTFASPDLQPGKAYVYTLDAEVVRDGHMLKESRRVSVRAGATTQVTLDFKPTRVALK